MADQRKQAASPYPAWATVDEWGRISCIGRTTTYAALRDGHLTARKLGGRTLINVAAGLAWIDNLPPYRPQTGARE